MKRLIAAIVLIGLMAGSAYALENHASGSSGSAITGVTGDCTITGGVSTCTGLTHASGVSTGNAPQLEGFSSLGQLEPETITGAGDCGTMTFSRTGANAYALTSTCTKSQGNLFTSALFGAGLNLSTNTTLPGVYYVTAPPVASGATAAVCDDTTDDGLSIQTLITWVANSTRGGTIVFPNNAACKWDASVRPMTILSQNTANSSIRLTGGGQSIGNSLQGSTIDFVNYTGVSKQACTTAATNALVQSIGTASLRSGGIEIDHLNFRFTDNVNPGCLMAFSGFSSSVTASNIYLHDLNLFGANASAGSGMITGGLYLHNVLNMKVKGVQFSNFATYDVYGDGFINTLQLDDRDQFNTTFSNSSSNYMVQLSTGSVGSQNITIANDTFETGPYDIKLANDTTVANGTLGCLIQNNFIGDQVGNGEALELNGATTCDVGSNYFGLATTATFPIEFLGGHTHVNFHNNYVLCPNGSTCVYSSGDLLEADNNTFNSGANSTICINQNARRLIARGNVFTAGLNSYSFAAGTTADVDYDPGLDSTTNKISNSSTTGIVVVRYKGGAPSAGTCGTSPGTPFGNDNRFTIVVGTGTVTSCAINFANTHAGNSLGQLCSVQDLTTAQNLTLSASTTAVTVTALANMAGDTLLVRCD